MTDPLQTPQAFSKDHDWYIKEVGTYLKPPTRALLEGYSHVPPDEVEAHILKCRDIAWSIAPYPCIGNFWFLSLGLSQHACYAALLERFRATPSLRLLDLGTCLGQDLRKLAFDGAPAAGLYGADLHAGYEGAGQALFCDAETWKGKFIAADVLDAGSALAATDGTWDVVQIFQVLHVFNLQDCKTAARQILKLLRPQPGSWVVGLQSASVEPGEMNVGRGTTKTVYRHSKETFVEMFRDIAKELGLEFDIWAEYLTTPSRKEGEGAKRSFFAGKDSRRLSFWIKTL